MNDKHTPGPWRPNGLMVEVANGMALQVAAVRSCQSDDVTVAVYAPAIGNAPRTMEQARANARLISAAPDMLEALRMARAAIDSYQRMDGQVCETAATRAIDAAIAKATGTSS